MSKVVRIFKDDAKSKIDKVDNKKVGKTFYRTLNYFNCLMKFHYYGDSEILLQGYSTYTGLYEQQIINIEDLEAVKEGSIASDAIEAYKKVNK